MAVALQLADDVASIALGGVELVYLLVSAITVTFSAVGALVAARHPRNAIGWIFIGAAMSTGIGGLASSFVEHRLQEGTAEDTLVGFAAAYAGASWIPFILVPVTFLLLLFPDGRLPSHRWRFVAWCAGAGIVAVFFTEVASEPIDDFPNVQNPFAIDSQLIEPLTNLSLLLMLVGIFGSVISVVVRFRRAGHVRRQQIKWLATVGAVVAVTFPVTVVLYDVVGAQIADATFMLTVLGLPAATGIAILRHRLYDIDLLINRALVYGFLTAALALVYVGSVVGLQATLRTLTGQESTLAVVASTLAIAALFNPLRGRVQRFVDRRFYRRKYDARKTLESLSTKLRNETELDTLSGDVIGVVRETMQPEHVSVWLRPDTASKGRPTE